MNDVAIQEELAHLRRATDDLSQVVAQQGDEIARLTRQLEMLLRRAAEAEAEESGGVYLSDARPPHY